MNPTHPQLRAEAVPVPVDSDSETTPRLGAPPVELRVRLPAVRHVAVWTAGAYVLLGALLAMLLTWTARRWPPAPTVAVPACDPNVSVCPSEIRR